MKVNELLIEITFNNSPEYNEFHLTDWLPVQFSCNYKIISCYNYFRIINNNNSNNNG